MAILTKYRVPGEASGRHVKKRAGQGFYVWFERSASDPRYCVAEGTCTEEDLPPALRAACDEYEGVNSFAFNWPLEVVDETAE